MNNDEAVEVAKLQKSIGSYIGGLEPNSLVFEFTSEGTKSRLNLITVNPIHHQSFLFHTTEGYDKVDALNKMLEYVKNYKEKESSYTIQWSIRNQNDLQTSYFRAKNIFEAMNKLTFGRDVNSIIVYSIVLNPIS